MSRPRPPQLHVRVQYESGEQTDPIAAPALGIDPEDGLLVYALPTDVDLEGATGVYVDIIPQRSKLVVGAIAETNDRDQDTDQ